MAILQLPPNPTRPQDPEPPAGGENASQGRPARLVRTGRFGELDEHELIHLLDSLDDERARAQFRESVYISTIICLAVAWFLFYGPHILLHQPYYKDPIALMKQHDREQLTYVNPLPASPPAPPRIDRSTMQRLQKEAQQAKIAPQTPAPPAPQQMQAMTNTPPVQMPALPTPPAPRAATPEAPLPAAPKPAIADNSQSPGEALRNSMRGAMNGGRGELPSAPAGGSPGPLQAGATILSDTQGVDFDPYMRRLRADLYRNWMPLMPAEVEPPIRKRGIVGIRFSIMPDGQIGDMKLETQSGDVALDKAAWYAITSEGQFPPLPQHYHGPQLDLRIGFYYNEERP